MLASSYFPRMLQYREFAENEFSGNLSLFVSSDCRKLTCFEAVLFQICPGIVDFMFLFI